jgi:hypothetical protein
MSLFSISLALIQQSQFADGLGVDENEKYFKACGLVLVLKPVLLR